MYITTSEQYNIYVDYYLPVKIVSIIIKAANAMYL